MKKFLILAAVFGVTIFAANKLMAQGPRKTSEMSEDTTDDAQEDLQGRFDKLGEQIKEKLAIAEEDLKNATEKTKGDLQKAVDTLKKQGRDVEKASQKLAQDVKDNWDTLKNELGDLATKIEKDLSK